MKTNCPAGNVTNEFEGMVSCTLPIRDENGLSRGCIAPLSVRNLGRLYLTYKG